MQIPPLPPRRIQPRKIGCGIVSALIAAAFIYGIYRVADEVVHGRERYVRAHVKRTLEEAQTHPGTMFFLHDRDERDEFVNNLDLLRGVNDFQIEVMYSGGADEFFAAIPGLAGLRVLVVGKTDLSATGLRHIATLPDLERLILYHLPVTGAGLQELQVSPQLSQLTLAPTSGKDISLRDLVASARVSSLSIEEPYQEHWIKHGIGAIDHALFLQELTLFCNDLTPEEVEQLRSRIPKCTVRAFRYSAGPDMREIAPPESAP